jgi:hypothetical protein
VGQRLLQGEAVDPVVIFDPEMVHYITGGRREILDRSFDVVEGRSPVSIRPPHR